MKTQSPKKRGAGPGRGHRHKPTLETRAQVRTLARVGVTHKDIGLIIGLGVGGDTILRRDYAEELALGRAEGVAAVAGRLFARAMDGDLGAQCFYLKTQGGWNERGPEPEPVSSIAIVIHHPDGTTHAFGERPLKLVHGDIEPPANDT